MDNSTASWQHEMQKLQNKVYGSDIRDQLVACLIMCEESHAINTGIRNTYFLPIIEWGIDDPIPPGWELNPVNGKYERVQEGGGNG